MLSVRGKIATLASAAVLTGILTTGARADSIAVSATAGTNGPSGVVLNTDVTLAHPSFVGSVLTEGRLASCASDYAAALTAPRSFTVTDSVWEQAQGSVGTGLGATVVIPRGTWSLCGWVQPGGEGLSVPASAAAGPAVFTVGGPEGTTSLPAPAVFGQEQLVRVQVAYTLAQAGAELPGSAQASLQLAVASSGSPCPGATAITEVSLDGSGPLVQSAALDAPASGEVAFTGRLAPGTYNLCAWLTQTFPQSTYGALPGLFPRDFGSSTQAVTVLPRPAVSRLKADLTDGPRRRHASVVAHYSLNEPSTVTLRLERIVPGHHSSSSLCIHEPGDGDRLCGIAHTVSSLQASGGSGANATRISIGQAGLARGIYLLAIHAENAAHEVSPTTTTTIVRTGPHLRPTRRRSTSGIHTYITPRPRD